MVSSSTLIKLTKITLTHNSSKSEIAKPSEVTIKHHIMASVLKRMNMPEITMNHNNYNIMIIFTNNFNNIF